MHEKHEQDKETSASHFNQSAIRSTDIRSTGSSPTNTGIWNLHAHDACLALSCHAVTSTLAAIYVVAARDVRRWFLPTVGDTLDRHPCYPPEESGHMSSYTLPMFFLSSVTHVPVRILQAISGNWRYARQTSVAAAPAVRCCFICGAVVSPRTPGRPLSRLCSYLANDAPLRDVGTTYISLNVQPSCMCTSSPALSDS